MPSQTLKITQANFRFEIYRMQNIKLSKRIIFGFVCGEKQLQAERALLPLSPKITFLAGLHIFPYTNKVPYFELVTPILSYRLQTTCSSLSRRNT